MLIVFKYKNGLTSSITNVYESQQTEPYTTTLHCLPCVCVSMSYSERIILLMAYQHKMVYMRPDSRPSPLSVNCMHIPIVSYNA